MEKYFIMEEFGSDIDSLLEQGRNDRSTSIQNGGMENKYSSSACKQNEITNISEMLDDDYSNEMKSLKDNYDINEIKNYEARSRETFFKGEPSVDMECDYDSFNQTCFEDNSVNNLSELREEVIHSQSEVEFSGVLSEHNYISEAVSYKNIKGVMFRLNSLLADLSKNPKKKAIEVDQISNALETIKTLLGVGSVLQENNMRIYQNSENIVTENKGAEPEENKANNLEKPESSGNYGENNGMNDEGLIEKKAKEGNVENECRKSPSNNTGGSDQVVQNKLQNEFQEFPENCSEPVKSNGESPENDANEELISDINQATNDSNPVLKNLNELYSFGKRIVKSCEDYKSSKTDCADILTKIISDFQTIFCHKTCRDMSVQTEYKYLSKEKQKKINEKEKERLLADSDSCTDEFDRNSQYSESDVYQSDEENSDPNEYLNHSDVYGHDRHSLSSDGLDLSKYVKDGNEDIEKRSEKSSVSVRDSLSRRHSKEGADIEQDSSDEEMRSDIEAENNNDNIDDSENVVLDINSLKNDNLASMKERAENDIDFSRSFIKDEKLKMEAVVIINKLTDKDLEDYYDDLREKEIEKLLNLKSLDKRKVRMVQYTNNDKATSAPKSKRTEKLLEILKDAEKDLDSDESNTEEEQEVITEKEYLERYRENLRQQLLRATSSDSDAESELSVDDGALADESDSSNDSDFPLLLDKFLKNFKPNEAVKNEHAQVVIE